MPFAIEHTRGLPELLAELRVSLLVSTYQAGKVIVISSDGERLIQLPRTFPKPMGLALDDDRLAVATQYEVVLLANDPRLAPGYPNQPGVYDALFVPRSTHYCGELQIHDMAWTREGLVGVNTLFSCLFRLDDRSSFVPVWQPDFISDLLPEDRCHLNGVAVARGAPRYVTALGRSDSASGWRARPEKGGVLIDVESREVVLADLAMPHTPRLYDGRLHLLLSATGELVVVDLERGRYDAVHRIPGFVRGMARAGDHVFVASSRIRPGHPFGGLAIPSADQAVCGITVIHLPTGARVGALRYLQSCEEIYDVQGMPGILRPGLLGTVDPVHRRALTTPERTFWAREPEPDDQT